MLLQRLQEWLTGIYDVPTPYCVDDFLFTDRARLPASLQHTGTDEQVLVVQYEEEAAIGLYLDEGLLQRLAGADPMQALHDGNLADYWSALEGVSHFQYLAWHGGHDRGVSLLELELQAEVDKYVTSWWLLRAQQPQRLPRQLHAALFEHCRVDEQLAGDRVNLYRAANRHAARFCQRLQRLWSSSTAPEGNDGWGELRRFYRLSCGDKLRYIQHCS